MRTSTNCLIMNLAICDILTTLILTRSLVIQLFAGDKWFGGTIGRITCKVLAAFGISVLLFCSVFNFVAIAIDRFLAVSQPLTYKLSSKWVVKIAIPATWLASALLAIEPVMSTQIEYYGGDGTPKSIKSEVSSQEHHLISATCLVVSFVVLIDLYSIIAYRLWRRNIPGEVSNSQHALAIRTARNVTVLMIPVVLITSVILWSPASVIMILLINGNPIYNTAVENPFLYAFGYWLFSNNSACNPCLYFIFIESFRQSLKIVCSQYCAPELRLCPIGHARERRFETEERTTELTSYRTVSHKGAPP